MKATTKVVGMVAGERQHVVAEVSEGDPVLLKPEPSNSHDPNAVAVYTMPWRHLTGPVISSVNDHAGRVGSINGNDRITMLAGQAGYLPKELAARIDLPADGVVGWVATVRYKPANDWIDSQGHSHSQTSKTPAGFDVTAWLQTKDGDDPFEGRFDL